MFFFCNRHTLEADSVSLMTCSVSDNIVSSHGTHPMITLLTITFTQQLSPVWPLDPILDFLYVLPTEPSTEISEVVSESLVSHYTDTHLYVFSSGLTLLLTLYIKQKSVKIFGESSPVLLSMVSIPRGHETETTVEELWSTDSQSPFDPCGVHSRCSLFYCHSKIPVFQSNRTYDLKNSEHELNPA